MTAPANYTVTLQVTEYTCTIGNVSFPTQLLGLSQADLSDADPKALGTAAAGSGTSASRSDHVHPTTGMATDAELTAHTGAAAGAHTPAAVGAEPADAAIQAHITGTGSPHTAAGVGAEASGAVSSHAGKTDGTAHGDSGVADPAVTTLTIAAGSTSIAVTTAARRFFADNGSATTLTVSAVTGLVNGGEPVTLAVKTTGAGLTITWPGTPVVWGDAPTAAGEYVYLLWHNSGGVLNVFNPGDSG